MQYQTTVYIFNNIVYAASKNNGTLPSQIAVKVAKTHTINNLLKYTKTSSNTSFSSSSSNTVSLANIITATSTVKSCVESNGVLSNYVALGSKPNILCLDFYIFYLLLL